MTPSDPAATLEEIKERHRKHVSINFPEPGICVSRCSSRWPCEAYRAASAAVAVLKLADEAEPVERDYGGEPIWWSLTPVEIREAITRTLNGDTDG